MFFKLQCHSLCFHCIYRSSNVYVNCYQIFWDTFSCGMFAKLIQGVFISHSVLYTNKSWKKKNRQYLTKKIQSKMWPCFFPILQVYQGARVWAPTRREKCLSSSPRCLGECTGKGTSVGFMALPSGWEWAGTRMSDFIWTPWKLRRKWCWWSA